MLRTEWESWKQWSVSCNMLPYICEVDWKDGLPLSWEAFWEHADPYSFVLESGRSGAYTYVGAAPGSILTGKGDQAVEQLRMNPYDVGSILQHIDEIQSRPAPLYENARILTGSPIDNLRRWMSEYRAPTDIRWPFFTGGCVGYVGYDVVRSLEKLPVIAASEAVVPDYAFMLVDHVWVYDHAKKKLIVCVYTRISREMANGGVNESKLLELYETAARTAEQMMSLWQACADKGSRAGLLRKDAYERASSADQLSIDLEQEADLHVSMSKEQFTQAVERIQEYIRSGDVFQVNLSVRQERIVQATPEVIYEWLRLLNPSPYMGLLRFRDYQLVSASPELLLKKDGRKLRTRPIAGTRRRGKTAAEDLVFESELRESEKERAEHVMLVDLERNDIGKAAEYGTVRVDQFMVIERYSHVMHLVSDVSGMLRADYDAFDALAAVFPGGTITGAPKIRTMEIIEELEPVRRGVYTGSFGWIDYNGNMEFNIIIRTLLAKDGRAYVQAGAGIVIDSIPVREYKESLSKAKALWKAVQYAERAEAGQAAAYRHKG